MNMAHNRLLPDGEHAPVSVWAGFVVMCIGMFMAILDVQIVATSLPSIQSGLKLEPEQMSWVQTAYLVAEVIAIPLTGFLTRLLSMRWLFVVALSVFTIASAGCAASYDFASLIAWRIVQGFSGGTLIPAVFSAVFLLFPERRQGVATTIAGVLAVLAPTIGPIAGGWITQTYSWHWLFLINVAPGIVAVILGVLLLPRAPADRSQLRLLDWISLASMALSLAALEIAMKQAPERGWLSLQVAGLFGIFVLSGLAFVSRGLASSHPVVDLRNFAEANFAIGCLLSFVLGIGLFGSVYLMPVFLAFVRDHNALEIGTMMLVTGMAQLLAAPVAVVLEQRVEARLLTAAGFAMFAAGLAMSAYQTLNTDFNAMFWPQAIRGLAIMFCLLPPTRLALGHLVAHRVPDASALFNLMRNLGGAIGLALIDTVIYSRAPMHGRAILARLNQGDAETARTIGIPAELFAMRPAGPLDADTLAIVQPLIRKAAFVPAINEAWAMIAILTALAIAFVPFAKASRAPKLPLH